MTATVHDLVSARERRGRNPLHFDTDLDALAFITAQLEEIRAEAATELLIPTQPLDIRLGQLLAVVGAIGDLYRRDERDTQ